MTNDKQPHEKLADKELNVKAAQEVHYQKDFKKADKAADKADDQNETNEEDE